MKCTDNYCVPMNHNKHIGPFKDAGRMEILVDFDIPQVVAFDEVKFNKRFLMYIGLTWVDHRIIGRELGFQWTVNSPTTFGFRTCTSII